MQRINWEKNLKGTCYKIWIAWEQNVLLNGRTQEQPCWIRPRAQQLLLTQTAGRMPSHQMQPRIPLPHPTPKDKRRKKVLDVLTRCIQGTNKGPPPSFFLSCSKMEKESTELTWLASAKMLPPNNLFQSRKRKACRFSLVWPKYSTYIQHNSQMTPVFSATFELRDRAGDIVQLPDCYLLQSQSSSAPARIWIMYNVN